MALAKGAGSRTTQLAAKKTAERYLPLGGLGFVASSRLSAWEPSALAEQRNYEGDFVEVFLAAFFLATFFLVAAFLGAAVFLAAFLATFFFVAPAFFLATDTSSEKRNY